MDMVAERITAEDIALRAGQFASDLRALGFRVYPWKHGDIREGRAGQGFTADHPDGWALSFSVTGPRTAVDAPPPTADSEAERSARDLALAWSGRAMPEDVVVHVPTEAGLALLERMREGGR